MPKSTNEYIIGIYQKTDALQYIKTLNRTYLLEKVSISTQMVQILGMVYWLILYWNANSDTILQ